MENNARRVQSLWHIQGCPLFPPRGPSSCSLALYGVPLVLRLGAILLSSSSPPFPGSTSPVRACLEQECLAHALAAGIRNILGSHYCQSLATAHQFIQRGRQITAAKGHAQICGTNNSTSARLRPGKDRSRSLRLGARVTGTVRFQMLLTCSGSAFNTPADSANYLCRFLTIWVMRGSGCPEA